MFRFGNFSASTISAATVLVCASATAPSLAQLIVTRQSCTMLGPDGVTTTSHACFRGTNVFIATTPTFNIPYVVYDADDNPVHINIVISGGGSVNSRLCRSQITGDVSSRVSAVPVPSVDGDFQSAGRLTRTQWECDFDVPAATGVTIQPYAFTFARSDSTWTDVEPSYRPSIIEIDAQGVVVPGGFVYQIPHHLQGTAQHRTLQPGHYRIRCDSTSVVFSSLGNILEGSANNTVGIRIDTDLSYHNGIDFNRDSVFPDGQDIDDFLTVFAGGVCPTGDCNDIDFNRDGVFPDSQDISDFLTVFAGGNLC